MKASVAYWLLVLFIGILFSFLRLYKIESSYLFFGDVGRDFYVLQNWALTGKPPLLGPQTSALPFNQSALYFYILFPFWLLLQHSLFSTIIANWLIHLTVFIAGFYLLKKNQSLKIAWLIVWFLVSIHPQFVIQHRYIWNPSFVGITVILAFFLFLQELSVQSFTLKKLLQQLKKSNKLQTCWQFIQSQKTLLLFSVSIALATGFSYSAIPLFLAFMLIGLVVFKHKQLKLLISLGLGLVLVNLPTIAFELRHRFVLTKMLLYQEKLSQADSSIPEKLAHLDQFILQAHGIKSFVLLISFLLIIGFELYKKKKLLTLKDPFILALSLFLITLLITLLVPISIHAHYIFPLLSCAFLTIAFCHWQRSTLFLIVASMVWLTPQQLTAYTLPAFRTTQQTYACAQKVCNQYPVETFVSVQAGYHVFHNGYEFQYLLNETGCQVKNLDTQNDQAHYMMVFADASPYEHGKTAYNELTQFGEAKEIDYIACTPQLGVHVLQR